MCPNTENDRTLSKNRINNFLLRVDLVNNSDLNLIETAEALSESFDRTEKRIIDNVTVNFTQHQHDLDRNKSLNYVLFSDTESITLTFSEHENAFWIQSSKYKNNLAYKSFIKLIINEISKHCDTIEAKRIGLRYINEFNCNTIRKISSIFGRRLSGITRSMLKNTNNVRVIGVEEYYDKESSKRLRLQYGIPNEFYPSNISTYDLLLDIDSYIEDTIKITDFEDTISDLNHSAYNIFINETNPKLIERLK